MWCASGVHFPFYSVASNINAIPAEFKIILEKADEAVARLSQLHFSTTDPRPANQAAEPLCLVVALRSIDRFALFRRYVQPLQFVHLEER